MSKTLRYARGLLLLSLIPLLTGCQHPLAPSVDISQPAIIEAQLIARPPTPRPASVSTASVKASAPAATEAKPTGQGEQLATCFMDLFVHPPALKH